MTTKDDAPKITSKVMDVTPDMAEKWLNDHNGLNRPFKNGLAEKYAASMAAGRWRLTPQGIAFDENDELMDGQHRLTGISLSQKTIRMWISWGWPAGSRLVLDDHAKRTPLDVAEISGIRGRFTSKHFSASRLMWTAGLNYAPNLLSNEMLIEFTKKYLPGLDFAVNEVFQGKKERGVTQGGVLAVIAQAYYCDVDKIRLQKFGQVLLDGRSTDPGDDAAQVLRGWLKEDAHRRGPRRDQKTIYRKTQRALYAFIKGERMEKLYEAKEQLFPLSDEGKFSKIKPPAVRLPATKKTKAA